MRYTRVQSLLFLLVLITSVPQLSERKERKVKCEKDRTVAWDISVPVQAEFLACWSREY